MKKDKIVQIRFKAEDKELLYEVAKRSPQGDFSSWITFLINQELERLVEFDDVVRDLVTERLNQIGVIR